MGHGKYLGCDVGVQGNTPDEALPITHSVLAK